MNNPFFSVIVPAYNSSAWIRKGLDSIQRQSWKDFELIVVCDSCTDNTAEIAREYTDKVIEVNYHLDGLARNAGIDAATGTWCLFMDDDDWFLHEAVFELIAEKVAGMENELDMLLFSFIWPNRKDGKVYARQKPSAMWIAVWSKCWRREFIGDTRFPPIPHWSDKPFMQEIIKKEPRIETYDMPMYYYNYLRKGSISWRKEIGEIE